MRTGRTLTAFRLETPPKNWRHPHPKNWRHLPPRKIGRPPSKLETSPWKIGDHPHSGPDPPPPKNWRPPPPVDRITDACKNITLAKTSFRPVKMRLVGASHSHCFGFLFIHTIHNEMVSAVDTETSLHIQFTTRWYPRWIQRLVSTYNSQRDGIRGGYRD